MWSRWVATLKVKIRGFAWICRVKPGKETHKSICDSSREKFVCVTGRIFSAIGFPPNGFRHTARGKPEHPAHKGIFDFNRNEELACKSQYMFCDWVPAKKVYEGCLRPHKRSRIGTVSGNVSKEKGVRASWTTSWCRSVEKGPDAHTRSEAKFVATWVASGIFRDSSDCLIILDFFWQDLTLLTCFVAVSQRHDCSRPIDSQKPWSFLN